MPRPLVVAAHHFQCDFMYQFQIDSALVQPINKAVEQYNGLLSGRADFFLTPAARCATQELNVLWNELRAIEGDQPALEIDFEEPLSRQQLIALVRAFSVSVFLGDGRYCSLLEQVDPMLHRHPNGFMLRQAFAVAEQNFIEMGVEKNVDPKFREMAAVCRDLMMSMRSCGHDIKHWTGPGITIIKRQPVDEAADMAC